MNRADLSTDEQAFIAMLRRWGNLRAQHHHARQQLDRTNHVHERDQIRGRVERLAQACTRAQNQILTSIAAHTNPKGHR